MEKFQAGVVSIPSRGSGKGDSPAATPGTGNPVIVSIPSRGSGKGDSVSALGGNDVVIGFQSPLGEVVKETLLYGGLTPDVLVFQSPLGEVVKETRFTIRQRRKRFHNVSIPSRGSGKGD